MPKIHPRTQPVGEAAGEIKLEFWRLVERHELTYGEVVSILGGLLADVGKHMVRAERHPDDPDKPGDTE